MAQVGCCGAGAGLCPSADGLRWPPLWGDRLAPVQLTENARPGQGVGAKLNPQKSQRLTSPAPTPRPLGRTQDVLARRLAGSVVARPPAPTPTPPPPERPVLGAPGSGALPRRRRRQRRARVCASRSGRQSPPGVPAPPRRGAVGRGRAPGAPGRSQPGRRGAGKPPRAIKAAALAGAPGSGARRGRWGRTGGRGKRGASGTERGRPGAEPFASPAQPPLRRRTSPERAGALGWGRRTAPAAALPAREACRRRRRRRGPGGKRAGSAGAPSSERGQGRGKTSPVCGFGRPARSLLCVAESCARDGGWRATDRSEGRVAGPAALARVRLATLRPAARPRALFLLGPPPPPAASGSRTPGSRWAPRVALAREATGWPETFWSGPGGTHVPWRKAPGAPEVVSRRLSALRDRRRRSPSVQHGGRPGAPPAAGFEVLSLAPRSQRCPQGVRGSGLAALARCRRPGCERWGGEPQTRPWVHEQPRDGGGVPGVYLGHVVTISEPGWRGIIKEEYAGKQSKTNPGLWKCHAAGKKEGAVALKSWKRNDAGRGYRKRKGSTHCCPGMQGDMKKCPVMRGPDDRPSSLSPPDGVLLFFRTPQGLEAEHCPPPEGLQGARRLLMHRVEQKLPGASSTCRVPSPRVPYLFAGEMWVRRGVLPGGRAGAVQVDSPQSGPRAPTGRTDESTFSFLLDPVDIVWLPGPATRAVGKTRRAEGWDGASLSVPDSSAGSAALSWDSGRRQNREAHQDRGLPNLALEKSPTRQTVRCGTCAAGEGQGWDAAPGVQAPGLRGGSPPGRGPADVTGTWRARSSLGPEAFLEAWDGGSRLELPPGESPLSESQLAFLQSSGLLLGPERTSPSILCCRQTRSLPPRGRWSFCVPSHRSATWHRGELLASVSVGAPSIESQPSLSTNGRGSDKPAGPVRLLVSLCEENGNETIQVSIGSRQLEPSATKGKTAARPSSRVHDAHRPAFQAPSCNCNPSDPQAKGPRASGGVEWGGKKVPGGAPTFTGKKGMTLLLFPKKGRNRLSSPCFSSTTLARMYRQEERERQVFACDIPTNGLWFVGPGLIPAVIRAMVTLAVAWDGAGGP
ncbi:collagen alpha-1(I) chain-like [Panthera leo]|uniref:collagen alpha-1(I) chain-like n=1 Tax=Panthera leo TaxID=9689 RepID=UPI001C69A5CA|nr:collagen alpha-1(I) chain-like [Panthera leo]